MSGGRDGSVRLTNLKTHKVQIIEEVIELKVLCGYEHTSKDEEENCSVEA